MIRRAENGTNRAEVIMLTIPCSILFRISCNSSALCSNYIILKSILKIIVKIIQKLSKWYFIRRVLIKWIHVEQLQLSCGKVNNVAPNDNNNLKYIIMWLGLRKPGISAQNTHVKKIVLSLVSAYDIYVCSVNFLYFHIDLCIRHKGFIVIAFVC